MRRVLGSSTLLPLCVCLAGPVAASPLPDELTISIGGHRQKLTRTRAYVPSPRRAAVMSMPVLQLGSHDLPDFPELLIVVTTADIAEGSAALPDYIAWRRAQGWRVIVATESQWDQPAPRDWDDRAARIREFLRGIYEREGAGYVLLIGDPDPDGDGVPMRRMEPMAHLLPYYPPSLADSLSGVPTDHYYADLDSDWDCDGDGTFGEYPDDAGPAGECADWGPELIVGRIPVYRGVTDLDAILTATVDYDTAPDKSARDTALFVGAFGGFRGQSSPGGDGSTYPEDDDLAAFLARTAADLPAGVGPLRLFEEDGVVISQYAHEESLSYNALIDGWLAGASTVSWGGHGSEVSSHRMVWRDDDDGDDIADDYEVEAPAFIRSDAADYLVEAPLAVVHMMSCLNGYPEHSRNLGAALLGSGAIATASASRSAVGESEEGWEPKPELGSATTNSYYFTLLVQAGHRVGDALAYTKWGLPADGWAIYEEEGADLLNAYGWLTKLEYNLYGDPTVSLDRCTQDIDCDDGSPCSGREECAGGYCVHRDPILCPGEPTGPCVTPMCDPESGGCVEVPVLDGTACDDGLYCTIETACRAGECVGTPRPCATALGYMSDCSESEQDCLLTPEEVRDEGCAQVPPAPVTILLISFLFIIIASRRMYAARGERA